jgi:hypothetical protein
MNEIQTNNYIAKNYYATLLFDRNTSTFTVTNSATQWCGYMVVESMQCAERVSIAGLHTSTKCTFIFKSQ